jgi:hypothetical protein
MQQLNADPLGMLLLQDPYFNEPNVERMRGTSEGNATSMRWGAGRLPHAQHNAVLQMLCYAAAALAVDVV